MAKDMQLYALLYFHNHTVVLTQDRTHGLENMTSHTLQRGKNPRGQSAVDPPTGSARWSWGHWVTSACNILSRGQSAQDSPRGPALTRWLDNRHNSSNWCRMQPAAGFHSNTTASAITHHGFKLENTVVFWVESHLFFFHLWITLSIPNILMIWNVSRVKIMIL